MSEVSSAADQPYTMSRARLFIYISFFCLHVPPSPAQGAHFLSFFLFFFCFFTFEHSFAIATPHLGQLSAEVTLSLGSTVFLTQI